MIGGGPAGMKAAVTASERGHVVTIYEADKRLGGQALLAQKLSGREEFGGLVTNLEYELRATGVRIETSARMAAKELSALDVDAIIVASGALPYLPKFEGSEDGHIVNAWDVLNGSANIGATVAIAD